MYILYLYVCTYHTYYRIYTLHIVYIYIYTHTCYLKHLALPSPETMYPFCFDFLEAYREPRKKSKGQGRQDRPQPSHDNFMDFELFVGTSVVSLESFTTWFFWPPFFFLMQNKNSWSKRSLLKQQISPSQERSYQNDQFLGITTWQKGALLNWFADRSQIYDDYKFEWYPIQKIKSVRYFETKHGSFDNGIFPHVLVM